MNVAAFNVAVINIPTLLNAPHLNLHRSTFFSVHFALGFFVHKFCCVTSHDESFGICLFLVISTIKLSRSLRILRNAHFRREEHLHDEDKLVAPHSKKFCQVSPINRAPSPNFSTFEKIKNDHNTILNNLLGRVYQVSSIDHLPQQISQPWYSYHDFPVFNEVEDDTTEGILAVKFIIGLDFAVTRSSPDSC